ncbi:MAG: transketolase [Candidatus Aminicenantes bacterium]|nr:transketolase [Candidatus Aminicenantes bacterium]
MEVSKNKLHDLERIASTIRKKVLKMVYQAQSGHLGGSFSVIEIVTALYFSEMRIDPENPSWTDRDRFVPSKGHCAPAIYAALALRGVFAPEALDNLRQTGCILQGHPCMKTVPGIDISTGSLGHGLSVGLGMALGARLKKQDFHVYVLLGDGELDEGQNWEAAMAASKYKLSNLTAIVDRNRVQLDGFTEDIMPLEPLLDKWKAFNWKCLTVDGHDLGAVIEALRRARAEKEAPVVVIANTTKGKGVSFMENSHLWHGKPPTREEFEKALTELGGNDENGGDRHA